jgi:hypothetical protein
MPVKRGILPVMGFGGDDPIPFFNRRSSSNPRSPVAVGDDPKRKWHWRFVSVHCERGRASVNSPIA